MADEEDVEDEEGVNILASSCLEYETCVKSLLFSFKSNLFKRIQTIVGTYVFCFMWIRKVAADA